MTRSPLGNVQILTALSWLTLASGAWSTPQLTAVERAKLVPENPLFLGISGLSVAACGDLTVVGAPEENIFYATSPGRAIVHLRDGSRWSSVAELTASDGAINDAFGTSVAIGSLFTKVAVGSPNAGPSGAVYIFQEQGTGWGETLKIVPPDATHRFGHSVDMHIVTTVIGAPFDSTTHNGAGAAYVYYSDQFRKLTASDISPSQIFGWSVAIDQQSGTRIVVGAPAQPDADTGAAYVFKLTPSGWIEEARLAPAGLDAGDKFG